jgi:hypothetical protein
MQVIIRSFGTFNGTLWDDVLSDFAPITDKDVILVNFGAWWAPVLQCFQMLEAPNLQGCLSRQHSHFQEERDLSVCLSMCCVPRSCQVSPLQDHRATHPLGGVAKSHERAVHDQTRK